MSPSKASHAYLRYLVTYYDLSVRIVSQLNASTIKNESNKTFALQSWQCFSQGSTLDPRSLLHFSCGENLRMVHCFQDEDAMMWLKRACDAHHVEHQAALKEAFLSRLGCFDFRVIVLINCDPKQHQKAPLHWLHQGITLHGHQNRKTQRAWCMKLSKLRTDCFWMVSLVN